VAYLVPPETYEWLMDVVDDYELGKIVNRRRDELSKAVGVNLDDLFC